MFFLNKTRVEEFTNKHHLNKLGVKWSCEGRIGPISNESLRKMRKSGCWQISFGVESGSQTILDYFNKRIKVAQIYETIQKVADEKINPRGYFIIGSPHETDETLEDTRHLIESLPFSDILIQFFTPLPGSNIYKDLISSGVEIDLNGMDVFNLNYQPEKVSMEKLIEFRNHTYLKFNLSQRRIRAYLAMLASNPRKAIHFIKSVFAFFRLIINSK
jgi:radical SAM superfamily enzyme YgiQ (UPF0313 family)